MRNFNNNYYFFNISTKQSHLCFIIFKFFNIINFIKLYINLLRFIHIYYIYFGNSIALRRLSHSRIFKVKCHYINIIFVIKNSIIKILIKIHYFV